jgi:hypothetical protein
VFSLCLAQYGVVVYIVVKVMPAAQQHPGIRLLRCHRSNTSGAA